MRDPDRYYIGEFEGPERNATEHKVTLVEHGHRRALPPRLSLINHSPSGLSWGYGGSGPAQLALAILRDALADVFPEKKAKAWAVRLHHQFKTAKIAPLDQDKGWVMHRKDVLDWVDHQPKPED